MCDQQSLRSACAYAQSDQILCLLLEYSMTVKLLTEQHLEFLSLTGGCTGWSESTHVKIPHCWKSRVRAQMLYAPLSHGHGLPPPAPPPIWLILDLYMHLLEIDINRMHVTIYKLTQNIIFQSVYVEKETLCVCF